MKKHNWVGETESKKSPKSSKHHRPKLLRKSSSLPNLTTKTHVLEPVFTIDRFRDSEDGQTVWVFNLPISKKKSRSLQNGGTPTIALPKMSREEIKNELTRPTTDCTITTDKDNRDQCKLTTSLKNKEILSFGRGTFNAVFSNTLFDDCDPEKQLLRVSINSFFSDYQVNEAVNEIYYSLIAADAGIGPKIYKFGSMVDSKNKKQIYIYLVMDRVDGCDIHKLLSKKKFPSTATSTSYCSSEDYPENFVPHFETILDKCIDQLYRAGTECGLLMMDSKPMNTLTTNDGQQVYVIDYDAKCMLNMEEDEDEDADSNSDVGPEISEDTKEKTKENTKEMYGITNVILFLCNLYQYFILYDNMEKEFHDFKQGIGKIVIQKLKEQYYKSTNFEHILDFIQDLYFYDPVFPKICHHYQYVQSEMLKIRYFIPYKLTFIQIYQMQRFNRIEQKDKDKYKQLNTFFISPTKDYPMAVNKTKDHMFKCVYTDKSGQIHTKIFDPHSSAKVYSLNRLCIPGKTPLDFTPFDFERQEDRDNILEYIKTLIGTYLKEFLKKEYEKVKQKQIELHLFHSQLIPTIEESVEEPSHKKRKVPDLDQYEKEMNKIVSEIDDIEKIIYHKYGEIKTKLETIYTNDYKENLNYFNRSYKEQSKYKEDMNEMNLFSEIKFYSKMYGIIGDDNEPFTVRYDNLLDEQQSMFESLM